MFSPPSGKRHDFREEGNFQEHKKDSFHKIIVGGKGVFSPKKWSIEGQKIRKC